MASDETSGAPSSGLTALSTEHAHTHINPSVSSMPVEMSQLDSPSTTLHSPDTQHFNTAPNSPTEPADTTPASTNLHDIQTSDPTLEPTAISSHPTQSAAASDPSNTTSVAPVALPPVVHTSEPEKESTAPETGAIGPSTEDAPQLDSPQISSEGPAVNVTLLLTTGARHPFRIDSKYLQKRNVKARDNDPYDISVYTMKELIWRDWGDDWEARPTNPTLIRLIHFGRLLDDKHNLRDCRFDANAPNVVHMTVKPADVAEDDDHSKSKMASRDRANDTDRSSGCRCCTVM